VVRGTSKGRALLVVMALLSGAGQAALAPDSALRAELIAVQERGSAQAWRLPQARVTQEEALLDGQAALTVTGPWQGMRWAFPRGTEPGRAFEDLRAQLPGTARFICAGRDCGSSALYAHEVFGVADLYGRDGEQHYALFEASDGVRALYVSQRGTREVFAQLIEVQGAGPALPTAAAARKALAETGRLRLQASEDTLRSWFTAPEQTWLATLPGRWLLLVHLQRGDEGRADALATSQALAATLAESLGAAEVRALGLGGAVVGRGAQAPEVELWRTEEGTR
jgi:hypothetical protein